MFTENIRSCHESSESGGSMSAELWNTRFKKHFASRLTDSSNFIDPSLVWKQADAYQEATRECAEKGRIYREGAFSEDPEGAADDAILYNGEEPYIL